MCKITQVAVSSDDGVVEKMEKMEIMMANRLEVDSRSVYVANVDPNATITDVRNHFRPCGFVVRVFIPRDTFTNKQRNFGFVEFAYSHSVPRALLLNNSLLCNRPILVETKRTNEVPYPYDIRPVTPPVETKQETEEYDFDEGVKLKYLPNYYKKAAPLSEEQKENDAKSVFVGNLNWFATKEDVKKHFEKCGEVVQVVIPIDMYTERQRNYAFVQFDTMEAVHKAILLNTSVLMSRPLVVAKKRQHDKTTDTFSTWLAKH